MPWCCHPIVPQCLNHNAMCTWCHGTRVPKGAMVPWCHLAVPPCHGTTMAWCHGATVSWCNSATWSHGAMVPQCLNAMAKVPQSHGATMPWCRFSAIVPCCHGATVQRCHGATVQLCPVPWCQGVKVQFCHSATMGQQSMHSSTVPRCHTATVARSMVPWFHGAKMPCMLQWCLDVLAPWCHGDIMVPKCHGVHLPCLVLPQYHACMVPPGGDKYLTSRCPICDGHPGQTTTRQYKVIAFKMHLSNDQKVYIFHFKLVLEKPSVHMHQPPTALMRPLTLF